MSDTKHTKSDRVREQIHDLSAGFREVATALSVPAGIPPEEDEERDLVDPEDVRDSIIGRAVTEPEDDSERFVA